MSATAVACPKCGGPTWDNRETKRNPKAPDYKCRDKACDGAVWPPRNGSAPAKPAAPASAKAPVSPGGTLPDEEEERQELYAKAGDPRIVAEAESFKGALLWVVQEVEPILREKGIGMSDDVAYKFAFSLWKGRAA